MRQQPKDLQWRKSTRCVDPDSDCVEVASDGEAVHVRDSTNESQVLTFTLTAWRAFAAAVRAGEFDSPSASPHL